MRMVLPFVPRGGIYSKLKLGRNIIEYGCGASIRKTLDGGIRALCDRNGCDEGRTWSRKVKWTKGGLPEDMTITVKVSAAYKDLYGARQLRTGIIESVRPESQNNKKIKWSWSQHQGWMQVSIWTNL